MQAPVRLHLAGEFTAEPYRRLNLVADVGLKLHNLAHAIALNVIAWAMDINLERQLERELNLPHGACAKNLAKPSCIVDYLFG